MLKERREAIDPKRIHKFNMYIQFSYNGPNVHLISCLCLSVCVHACMYAFTHDPFFIRVTMMRSNEPLNSNSAWSREDLSNLSQLFGWWCTPIDHWIPALPGWPCNAMPYGMAICVFGSINKMDAVLERKFVVLMFCFVFYLLGFLKICSSFKVFYFYLFANDQAS